MRICLAGWYFHEPLFEVLDRSKYGWFVVAHRKPEDPDIPAHWIPNVGLEFGCYDWFLKNEWKGDDVLFMHDDNEITEKALDLISKLDRDQVFLFSSEEEARANGYAHGRAMFCSEKFLRKLYVDGGFWFDEGNTGQIPPTTAEGPNFHNAGIQTFRAYLTTLPKILTANRMAVVPGLKTGYRGRI